QVTDSDRLGNRHLTYHRRHRAFKAMLQLMPSLGAAPTARSARLTVCADRQRCPLLAPLSAGAGLARLALLGFPLAPQLLLQTAPLALFLAALFFLGLTSRLALLLHRHLFGHGFDFRRSGFILGGRTGLSSLGCSFGSLCRFRRCTLLRLFGETTRLFLGSLCLLFRLAGLFLSLQASVFLGPPPRLFFGPLDVVLENLFQHLDIAPMLFGL